MGGGSFRPSRRCAYDYYKLPKEKEVQVLSEMALSFISVQVNAIILSQQTVYYANIYFFRFLGFLQQIFQNKFHYIIKFTLWKRLKLMKLA